MTSDSPEVVAAFASVMNSASVAGFMDAINANVNQSSALLGLAIEKSTDDAEYLKKLKALSIGLDMLKLSVEDLVSERKDLHQERLNKYAESLRGVEG